MKVVILKYNAGNVRSVTIALNRLGIEPTVSDEHDVLLGADKVIFPGVGQASTAMKYLKERRLEELIPDLKNPFLGVCLGLQLMCRHTEENNTTCLNIFSLEVKKFPAGEKVPHMGWNTIHSLEGSLTTGLNDQSYLYFVHSYYAELSAYTVATTDYMIPFSAILQRDNFYAVQAHPEKSSAEGQLILKNFLDL